jgi:disulfide bond formation protein DsbB
MTNKISHILLLLLASGSLFFAYIAEYIFHLAPCPLCVYQRFPYVILIFIAIMALAADKYRPYNKYLIITALLAIIIAGYHTGVENGIFELSALCKPLISIKNNISVEDFTKILYNQETPFCNKPALVILGFSLTEWNLLLNVALLIFLLVIASWPEPYKQEK